MKENKKSFILYSDLITVVEKLVLKDREEKTNNSGELFFHILQYVNGLNPTPIDFLIEIIFDPIKLQLKRDLEKYEDAKDKSSTAGRLGNLKRWNIDIYDKVIRELITLEEGENIAKNRIKSVPDTETSPPDNTQSHPIAKITDTDTDTVNVIVTDNLNDISLSKEHEKEIFDFFNLTCTNLPRVQLLNETRKKKINARISEVGFEKLKEILVDVSKSDFLNGKSERKWKADFDWILKPENFTKILEGNYKNKNYDQQPQGETSGNLSQAKRR